MRKETCGTRDESVLYSKRRVSPEKISSFVFLLRGDITMAAKKKAKKGQSKSVQAARKKKTPLKKAPKKKIALKGQISKQKPASKAHKKVAGKKKITLKGDISKKKPASKAAYKKVAGKRKIALKRGISKKKPASKASHTKVAGKKSKMTRRKLIRETIEPAETVKFLAKGPTSHEGGQSGDLQGLSNIEVADSESVVELLEEGNAFEAAIVAGVENADSTEPSEVQTHEVLEDDVPREYLDRE
jgi:hypothetical protein